LRIAVGRVAAGSAHELEPAAPGRTLSIHCKSRLHFSVA
jgi:hypothetical protein